MFLAGGNCLTYNQRIRDPRMLRCLTQTRMHRKSRPTYIHTAVPRQRVSPRESITGDGKSKHKDGRQVARGSKDPRDYFRDQRLRGNAPSRRGWLLAGTPAATRRSRLSWDSAPPTRVTEQRNSLGLMTSRLGAPASSVKIDQRRACQGPVRHSGATVCTVTSHSA